MVPLWVDVLNYDTFILLSLIYNSINILAPVVVTVACYLSMIFAVSQDLNRNSFLWGYLPTKSLFSQLPDQLIIKFLFRFGVTSGDWQQTSTWSRLRVNR